MEEFRIKTAVVSSIRKTSKYEDLLCNKLTVAKLNAKGVLEGPCAPITKNQVISVRAHAKRLGLPVITRRADKDGETFNVWRVEKAQERKSKKGTKTSKAPKA